MGYQVIYDGDDQGQGRSLRFRLIPLTGAAWLAFLMLVEACWPRGQEVLREVLVPDTLNAALIAVNAFAENLRSGEMLPQAWEAFCYAFAN